MHRAKICMEGEQDKKSKKKIQVNLVHWQSKQNEGNFYSKVLYVSGCVYCEFLMFGG